MMTVPKLFSVEEVATATRSTVSTVRFWIYTGRLTTVKAGRHRLIPEPSLAEFLGLPDGINAAGGGGRTVRTGTTLVRNSTASVGSEAHRRRGGT